MNLTHNALTANAITPIDIINAIRNNIKGADVIFTQGKCYQLYLMLSELYPQSIAWYCQIAGHVYTEIDGLAYDINGVVELPKSAFYIDEEPTIKSQAGNWDYKQ